MKNKLLFKILNVAIYCVGFPVLAIVTLVLSIQWNNYGMYGAGAFAPFLFVLVAWLLSALIVFAVRSINKKRGKEGKGKLKFAGAIVPLVLIFGIMLIFEAALPPILDSATSGTIKYEDVLEDADGMHDKLVERVDAFKEKNKLGKDVKYSDKEFQKILTSIFPSMDKAYHSFNPLAISVALEFPDVLGAVLNGDLPISLAATLILETVENDPLKFNEYLSIGEIVDLNSEKIVNAIASLLSNIDKISDGKTLDGIVNELLLTKTFDGVSWNIFNILGSNIINPANDPNAKIVRVVEGKKDQVLGAALGYQDMAWLDGLDQMFFIPLMSARTLLFGFAIAIAMLALLQSCVQAVYFKKFGTEISVLEDIKNVKNKKSNKNAAVEEAGFGEAPADEAPVDEVAE